MNGARKGSAQQTPSLQANQICPLSTHHFFTTPIRQDLHAGRGHAGWAALPSLQAAGKKLPLALQLYSVRDDCGKDFDAALAQVAKMGFTGVEFAGYHNYGGKGEGTPQEAR